MQCIKSEKKYTKKKLTEKKKQRKKTCNEEGIDNRVLCHHNPLKAYLSSVKVFWKLIDIYFLRVNRSLKCYSSTLMNKNDIHNSITQKKIRSHREPPYNSIQDLWEFPTFSTTYLPKGEPNSLFYRVQVMNDIKCYDRSRENVYLINQILMNLFKTSVLNTLQSNRYNKFSSKS